MSGPSVETWIDKLAAIWEIPTGNGNTVRSFHVFDRNELPAAIDASMAPCATSYPTSCRPEYSAGGPTILFWKGQTEFHLTEDVKPANVPFILPFYGRILAAAMANMKLSGTVELFLVADEDDALVFVTFPKPDGTPDHQGIVVKWQVKQPVTGLYTVSA